MCLFTATETLTKVVSQQKVEASCFKLKANWAVKADCQFRAKKSEK